MRKYCISFNIFWINILFASAVRKDICEQCLKIEECPSFAHLNKHEQQVWLEQVPCEGQQAIEETTVFGYSPVAKGDYVCCPKSNIWENDSNNGGQNTTTESNNKREIKPVEIRHNNNEGLEKLQQSQVNQNLYSNQNYNGQPIGQNFYGNQQNRPIGPIFYGNGQNNLYGQNPNYQQYPNSGNAWSNPRQPVVSPGQVIQNVGQNPYYRNPYYNNGNRYGRPNRGDQCAAETSLLPDPETHCCGRDMSDALRITGGKETELDQFPWTVLLKMTFSNDNSIISLFNCGGSLISRRYVLTAGHCVFEPGAKLIGVNVTLAEYDKRTFPKDCKYEIGQKPKCIDNVLMFGEEVILHPQYDDDQLHNDIALIRLQGYAPYTRYIRPVCLPPIDIDNNDLSNLPLAVAGWGRNGQYVSDIKQSTVVHLVSHDDCKKSYPYLSSSHLCAAGRTGQDTCKGDSGGPLMMMFKASYYVIGVVSGKRADSPCGTTVPSLYTNVFHYVPWIRSNIRS
ncbi:CLIP domain-containing serine protease B4-like isoform X2 [Maniola hyperantus]|uniref:CLIP domain-containing serine protease B4-like isoform X2 n=1 Tax=Aphantopus hyperantus TaxID=2795564 RepID=UPI00374872DB